MRNTIPKHEEKISDKVLSQTLIFSTISILLCIVALCSATYAWFVADVSSHSNRLETGRFDLVVLVSNESGESVDVTDSTAGAVVIFEDAGIYTVTLAISDDTTASRGFCKLKVGDVSYTTASISRESSGGTFVFKIKTTEPNTVITFISAWGIPAHEDVKNEATLIL